MRLHGIFAALAVATALAGCATPIPEHVALGGQAQGSLTSTEVVLPISESEIYIDVPASHISTATGGGLLPALIDAGIDSARASSAAKAVTPLRNAVVDFSFDESLTNSFRALSDADGLHVDNVRVIKDSSPSALDTAISASKSNVALIASADYHLANDAGSLWIFVHAAVYRSGVSPAASPSAAANALYRNTICFTVNLPQPTKNRDDNVAAWSADHGALLRSALKKGATKISQLVAADIHATNAAPGAIDQADGRLERKADGTEQFFAFN
jgi:hypothetical protein